MILSGILSGIGVEVIKNTVFTAYKSSVYKHVVPGAGIERADFYWAHDSLGVILA
jgi:hypothetical protein